MLKHKNVIGFLTQAWFIILAYVLPECCNIMFLLMDSNHLQQHVLWGLVDTWEQHTIFLLFLFFIFSNEQFHMCDKSPHVYERSVAMWCDAAPPALMEE